MRMARRCTNCGARVRFAEAGSRGSEGRGDVVLAAPPPFWLPSVSYRSSRSSRAA